MDRSSTPLGRFTMGKDVAIIGVIGVASIVLGFWALVTGAADPVVPFVIVGICLVGGVLGVRFLRR